MGIGQYLKKSIVNPFQNAGSNDSNHIKSKNKKENIGQLEKRSGMMSNSLREIVIEEKRLVKMEMSEKRER